MYIQSQIDQSDFLHECVRYSWMYVYEWMIFFFFACVCVCVESLLFPEFSSLLHVSVYSVFTVCSCFVCVDSEETRLLLFSSVYDFQCSIKCNYIFCDKVNRTPFYFHSWKIFFFLFYSSPLAVLLRKWKSKKKMVCFSYVCLSSEFVYLRLCRWMCSCWITIA